MPERRRRMPALRRIDAAARLIAVIPAFILTKGEAPAKHEQQH